MARGNFIVFEGIDASGKSTQAKRVAAERDALFTFEPGDSELGAELRRWLLSAATPMAPETESLLMLADRSHHVRHLIAPVLAEGRHVVSDRFLGSTLAYQGYGRGVDLALLREATLLAIGEMRPALTILIDIPLEVANERRARNAEDRFESASLDFHQRVREGFLSLAASEADWVVVDGAQTLADVTRDVDLALDRLAW